MEFKEVIRNPKLLGSEVARNLRSSQEFATKTLSTCAFVTAIPNEITTTASLLPLEPWQTALIRFGIVAFTAGMYLSNVASTLHANQGRDPKHKLLGNLGLVASGAATAAIDVIAITAPL